MEQIDNATVHPLYCSCLGCTTGLRESPVVLTLKYGSVKTVEVTTVADDGTVLYGAYSIHYDESGNETKRTPVSYFSSLSL